MQAQKRLNQDLEEPARPLRKLLLLTLLKEGYLFLRNYYGLLVHPSRTIIKIRQKPDWSQTILIFGLPGYFWAGTIFFLAILRFLIGIRANLGWVAQTSLVLVTSIAALLFVYLLYFLFVTFKKFNRRK